MARIKIEKDTTKKDVILKAAATLFREKGYKAASMRDLAERVGIEAASLYNHIRSKAELLHDICFNSSNLYIEHIDSVMKTDMPELDKVETILRFQIKQMIEHFDDRIVADREWKHLPEPYLANYQVLRHNYRKKFNEILSQGIENGEIKNINVPSTIWLLLHAISGIESWHRSRTKIDPQILEDNMITILIGGLKK